MSACAAATGIPVSTLKHAKLQVELRQLKHELIPVGEVTRLGAGLGTAIRKVITRTYRLAPWLEGQPAIVIEARLQDHEGEIAARLQLLEDRLRDWQRGT